MDAGRGDSGRCSGPGYGVVCIGDDVSKDNQEALAMSRLLCLSIESGCVNAQYDWAELILLDALARGAKGPVVEEKEETTMKQNCGSCKWANWLRLTTHKKPRFAPGMIALCSFDLSSLSIPYAFNVEQFYVTPTDGENCPCWAAKEQQ